MADDLSAEESARRIRAWGDPELAELITGDQLQDAITADLLDGYMPHVLAAEQEFMERFVFGSGG